MKGDNTLPKQYQDSVKMEFPRAASAGYEEYNVRPYDFCFLFDAQNAEGSKLNSFNQYLDHAANCIYAQSIGPMNKRSNSSEDNTIRRLCEERGRNRYAGAGSSMLIYPVEDVKEYLALNWVKECVSSQWMIFDHTFNELRKSHAVMRARESLCQMMTRRRIISPLWRPLQKIKMPLPVPLWSPVLLTPRTASLRHQKNGMIM